MRGIAASWLLTGDAATPPIADGAVVLDADGTIVAVGPRAPLQSAHAGAAWERHAAVLTPGLVNAHTHIELSALRGRVSGGRGFADWVGTMLSERERVDPTSAEEAIQTAVDELVDAGTVAVGDITNSLDAVDALARSTLSGCVFHEVFGPSRAVAETRLREADARRAAVQRWPAAFRYAPAPHTPFTVPPDLLVEIVRRARALGARTSLHLCEHAPERAYLRDGSGPIAALFARFPTRIDWVPPGKDPVAHVADLGVLGPDVLCVHLTDARDDEIAVLAAAQATVVLCPRSNLHIELRLPPLASLLRAGIRPALGTDSLASAPSLDVLDEARALRARFPGVPPRTLLAMTTSWGADALGLGTSLGQLVPGRTPGVVAFAHGEVAPADPEAWLLAPGARPRRVLATARASLAPGGTP